MSQYEPPKSRAELQARCDHRGAEEYARSWDAMPKREVLIAHLRCSRCGLLFGREIYGAARAEERGA